MNLEEIFSVKNIIIYLVIINLIAFLAMWLDKRKAEKSKWRIPENSLLLLVLLGGGIGGIAGMYIFRHKTKTILIKEFIQRHRSITRSWPNKIKD